MAFIMQILGAGSGYPDYRMWLGADRSLVKEKDAFVFRSAADARRVSLPEYRGYQKFLTEVESSLTPGFPGRSCAQQMAMDL